MSLFCHTLQTLLIGIPPPFWRIGFITQQAKLIEEMFMTSGVA